mgnify:CR=1 FL=1
MSSAEIAANAIKDLSNEEVRLLYAFSNLIYNYEIIPERLLAIKSNMHIDRVRFGLSRLHKHGFISKEQDGYILLTAGLDALALKILTEKGIISGFGKPIGVGKEADIFECIGLNNRVALKFFRIGRISFRDIRKREFKDTHSWLTINISMAKREFLILTKLYNANVKVPRPIANVKHVIAMDLIEGKRLANSILDNPMEILRLLLDEIKKVYEKGIVIADLSEYNILYDGNDIWLIDFPQAISNKDKNAHELLRRDIKNILRYFERRYRVEYNLDEALAYITSKLI